MANSVLAKRNPFTLAPQGWAGLLQDEAVQKEVNITAEQQAAIQKIVGGKLDKPEAVEAAIRKLLDEAQIARVEQLDWRREGGYAIFRFPVAQALELTEQQKQALRAAYKVNESSHQEMRDFMARARFASREAMEDYVAGFRDKANARLLVVLTDEQAAKLKEMLGKPLV